MSGHYEDDDPVFEDELIQLDKLCLRPGALVNRLPKQTLRRLIFTIRILREGIAAREAMEKQRIKDIKRRRGEQ